MKFRSSGIKEFFWPSDAAIRLRRAELTFWAFLLAVAYLPLPLGFLAWFALIRPLAIITQMEGKTAFKAAYFYSFMANLFQLYWVAVVTPPGMVAAIFILSLYPAFILLLFTKIYQRKKLLGLIALPFLWVGMEYFRSLSEFAFPWTDISYSQGYYLSFIQIVSVIGSYGLSFILVGLNIVIWQAISKSNKLETRISSAIAALVLVVSVYLYGWVVIPPLPMEGNIRIALLQGNVDLDTKWDEDTRDYNFTLYDSLAGIGAKDSADLIVWPETAAPAYPRFEPNYMAVLSETAIRSRAANLIGAIDVDYSSGKRKSYNSAFQFSPDGSISGIYHKIKLVPYSERSPYQEQFPILSRQFLEKYVRVIRMHDVEWWSDFYSGDSIVIFNVDSARYTVLICFESAFPQFVREGVLKGADFIVNITNDTWFGRSPGPFQHMRIAVFRAIENRVWLMRCANSGISAAIDPYGREIVRAGLYVQKVISANIYPIKEYSAFTRVGPIVGIVSLYITGLILLLMLIIWSVGKLTKEPDRSAIAVRGTDSSTEAKKES